MPSCINEIYHLFLAHWIMQHGYFDKYGRRQTIILCAESFTKEDCLILQNVLSNMGIKSTLKIKAKDTYRIRIPKLSMPLVRELVTPYMHSDFMYKLGE